MSPRSFFARLLSPSSNHTHLPIADSGQQPSRRQAIVRFFIVVALILSAVWLLLAIWYQFGAQSLIAWSATIVIVGLLTASLAGRYITKRIHYNNADNNAHKSSDNNHHKGMTTAHQAATLKKISAWLTASYAAVWLIGAGWFISITPQQQRDWKPEVSQLLSYERNPHNSDLITLKNVRNFDWHTGDEATERWETRTIDMSKLSGVDVINSYWMGPLIAHTLVSFRFEDDRPLSLSLEIRKENGETFSALGGFFKRYELSLIAAEERDILYTRSNARGEQVYLFPVSHLQQDEVQSLFESYLTIADDLTAKPAWYNTLTSNCTSIIFYMARVVSGERLPWDYRIWVSGWLPNYLYEIKMLDAKPEKNSPPWSMDKWYEQAHINPKVIGFDNSAHLEVTNNSRAFSDQIRQGLIIPPLADTQADAKNRVHSAAIISND